MSAAINQVLVVGASGRVGQLLARAWALNGLQPVLQHRGTPVPVDLPQLDWSPMNGPLPAGQAFGAMIILAGIVPGRGDLTTTAALADACLSAAHRAAIPQVLLASSSAIYGSRDGKPFCETDPVRPVNDYGRAKLQMEAVAATWRVKGLPICTLRIGNVAGADQLLLNVAAGQPVLVDQFADGGGPVRSYIGPQTLARVLAALIGQKLPDVMNVAGPLPVAMADLAQASGATWAWRPAPPDAVQLVTLDSARLGRFFSINVSDSTAAAMVSQWHSVRGQT